MSKTPTSKRIVYYVNPEFMSTPKASDASEFCQIEPSSQSLPIIEPQPEILPEMQHDIVSLSESPQDSRSELFQYKAEIRLLQSNLKAINEENSDIIKCYQEMVHIFKVHEKEHQLMADQIQSVLRLSTDQIEKMMLERGTNKQKLDALKLKLDQFKISRKQCDVVQFTNIINYYHNKNKELIEMMKEFNTKSVNEFYFSRKLFRKTYPWNADDTVFLMQNKKIKNRGNLKGPQINLAEPPIADTVEPEFNKIRFKINRMPSKFLYLGAFKLSSMLQEDFEFDRKLGNGAYVIAAHSGYSFSNDYEEENFRPTGFKFGTGDIIDIEHIPDQSVLKFSNNNKYFETKLRINRDQDLSSLHFCVITLNQNTEIEIISQQE